MDGWIKRRFPRLWEPPHLPDALTSLWFSVLIWKQFGDYFLKDKINIFWMFHGLCWMINNSWAESSNLLVLEQPWERSVRHGYGFLCRGEFLPFHPAGHMAVVYRAGGESWADYVCNVRAWEPWLSSIMIRLIKVNSSADFKNTKGYGSKSGIWTFKIPSERKKSMLLISAFWEWNGKEINVFLQIITLKTLCHILDGSVFESYLSRKKDFFSID